MLQLPPLSASYLAGLSDADRRYAVMVDKLLRQLLPLLQYPSYTTPDDVDADIAAHVAEADPHTQYLLETVAALTYQPLDSDLTAIAALATVSFGRGLLELGSGPAVLTYIGGQPLDATLTALAAYNTNGLLTQTAADTFTGRTLQAPAAGFSITNPAGIAGDPTFALTNDLAALEDLASTGIAVRTAANTWVQRSIAAGTGISVTNGDGVSGNPTVALSTPLTVPNGGTGVSTLTGLVKGNGTSPFSAAVAGTDYMTPAGVSAAYQPLDSDLTAIALLTTTSFGRALLELANAAALRTAAGLGTIATQDANNVTITGGSVTGITDLVVADGGTGVSTLTGLVKGNGTSAFSAAVQGTDYYAPGGTDVAVADGGTGASTASGARTNLGLGTIAVQDANNVTITGGSVTGIADLAVADGGTGASTAAGARTNLGLVIGTDVQAYDADLTAYATVTPSAYSLTLFDNAAASDWRTDLGLGSLATASSVTAAQISDASANGRSLISAADYSAMRTLLSLVVGTNVQAYDAELAALAGLTSAADKLPYWTGSGTAANADFSAYGRTLVDDADAATARTTLGLVIGTNVQAYDAELAALAGLTSAADKLPYFTGAGTAALATFTAAGRALVDDADAAAQRTTLGLGTIATQAASGVAITGGTITGITDLAVADGGTGASTASGARTNLGAVNIAGDTLTGTLTTRTSTTGAGTEAIVIPVGGKPASTVTGALYNDGSLHYTKAAGSISVGGAIFDYSTNATTGTTETDMFAPSIPANMLAANGDKLEFVFSGTITGHASRTREIRMYWGSNVLIDNGATVYASNADWTARGSLIRASSTTARVEISFFVNGVLPVVDYVALATLDFTTANTLKITGQSGAGSAASDITGRMGWVRFSPAASL